MRRIPVLLWQMVICVALVCPAAPPLVANPAQSTVRVECHTAFDDLYFYVGANVQKNTLRGTVSGAFQDPRGDDCVLVQLAGAAEDGKEKRVEMAVGVAQAAQLFRGASREPLKGFEDFLTDPDGTRVPFKYQVRLRGQLNGPASPDNGFTVELAIPWVELGGPPRPGAVFHFNVAVLAADDPTRVVASLSPEVTGEADLEQVERWSRIVFTDAPVSSVPGAPGAVVCSRVYTAKPLIDGVLAEGEWSRVTALQFEGRGTRRPTMLGSTASARARAPVTLRPARPVGRLLAPPSTIPGSRKSRQPWPRLVFARYRVDYQCDTRKNLPLRAVAMPSGQTLIATHPMDGTGPWFSYDRIDWHRIQMTRMREAHVDVAAVTFRPDRQGRLALTALTAALSALDTNRADHPRVCLWLNAEDLQPAAEAPRRALQALDDFLRCVPARYRLMVSLLESNGPGAAPVVVLSGTENADLEACIGALRGHAANPIVLTSGVETATADGYIPDASQEGYASARQGALHIGALYAGSLGRQPTEHPLARRSPTDYRASWRRALADAPDWVFIESWNDHTAGSEITPTVEYGLEYLDITAAHVIRFLSRGAFGGSIVAHNVPAQTVGGSTLGIRLTLRNHGTNVWTPEDTVVVFSWQGGPSIPPIPVPSAVSAGEFLEMNVRLPLPREEGTRRCTVSLRRVDKRRGLRPPGPLTAAELGSFETRVVAPASEMAGSVLTTTLTRAMESQSTYPVSVVLRNEGAATWMRNTTFVTARLLEQRDDQADVTLTDMADASVPLPEDVPPGSEYSVTVPITIARADGSPFRHSSDDSPRYFIRFDLDAVGEAPLTIPLDIREVELVETDPGVTFFNDYTPSRIPAGRRIPIPIGVRNRGSQTWLKDQVAVGYHWYFLDGTEAVWEDEVSPLRMDVPPGAEVGDIGAFLTAPPNDGAYWLVWDLRIGDTWASTLIGVRAYETRVALVQVIGGRLHFVDLAPVANIRAAAVNAPGVRGQFDEEERAFPAELTPPFAVNLPVPATIWLPEARSGTYRSRQMSFRWLPASGPSGVSCQGQSLTVNPPRQAFPVRRVHILAASIKPEERLEITLKFANGSEQLTTFPVKTWDSPPGPNDSVAFAMPYSRATRDGSTGPPVFAYWYVVNVKENTPLSSVVFGQRPAVRVLAMTLER